MTPPIVKALLVCDYVILDRDTGKNSFIGVFHRITVRRLPAHHPPMWIVAEVTELEGKHDFEFLLINNAAAEGPQPVARGEIRGVPFKNRHEIYTIRFQTGPVPLPNPGRYDVQFSCDGRLIESQSFEVRLLSSTQPEGLTFPPTLPPILPSGDE